MVKTRMEWFVLCAEDNCNGHEYPVEAYSTFAEAESHIADRDERGGYLYMGWWTNAQACVIKHFVLSPAYKLPTVTEEWRYCNEKLMEHINRSR